MNRTYLEGVAEKLSAAEGYVFYTGPESDMAHAIRSYPAIWMNPLKLNAIEGRRHGRATYDITLHLLSAGARLTGRERSVALATAEDKLIAFFAALSLEERILAVEELAIQPRQFALTPHGEISQTATARIVTFF